MKSSLAGWTSNALNSKLNEPNLKQRNVINHKSFTNIFVYSEFCNCDPIFSSKSLYGQLHALISKNMTQILTLWTQNWTNQI